MKRRSWRSWGTFVCAAAMLFTVLRVAAVAQSTLHVIQELKHDVSPPLAELERMTPAQPNPFSPRVLKVLPTGPMPPVPEYAIPDAALQKQALPPVAATLGLNFEGLGFGQYGFALQVSPPDSNGNVGATQYVQWVNLEFAVFDKNTGALVAGPVPGNALWAGFGGPCETQNDGDPIVQYDKLAQRWVLTQLMVSSVPYMQCVAVSTTSDATGPYNRYAFSFGNNFNDYPKMGVWPDAYYMSFNMFLDGQTFEGAAACAMDRNSMLNGQAATIICFQQNSGVPSLLPADMDGTIPPASGEPGFFVDLTTNPNLPPGGNQLDAPQDFSLRLFKFHVDFTNPANSTFKGPVKIPIADFTQLGPVAQPGTTQKLDSLGDRLMYRLAYRKFADGLEALVVNHSITTGVRWYDVRDPNGTPTLFQQGTFSPDSNTRWMGSIATDQAGNIALGYSVSSSSVFPSIFFTGRAPSDPLGSMQSEQVIVNGAGSQTGGLSRWGDYSSMTIDPADDCTFWYTQEYIKSNGSFNWSTRIANFKFDSCSVPAVTLVPTALKWYGIVVGTTSGAKAVTLTNTGNAPLNISSIAASGDFAIKIVKNSCGNTVAAGASCLIKVTFTPTQIGIRIGSLTITDNAPDSPQNVSLTGKGK
ncbi:MAG: choice-of-anchor D domain-containing protein [Terriglobales bacterium]